MNEDIAVYKPDTAQLTSAWRNAMIVVGKMAGVNLRTTLDIIRLTQHGLEPTAVDALKERGLSPSELHWIINPRTLNHRRNNNELLTPEETGRWLRAAKIHALAVEVFADQNKALDWLHKPLQRFDGQSAMKLIQTEAGAQLVEEILNQLDSGFFA